MVLEIAGVDVVAGSEQDFIAAVRSVRHLVTETAGCQSLRMTQGVETPTRFRLLIEWDSVQAHEENFRQAPKYVQWRATIGPFFANPPRVEHFTDV